MLHLLHLPPRRHQRGQVVSVLTQRDICIIDMYNGQVLRGDLPDPVQPAPAQHHARQGDHPPVLGLQPRHQPPHHVRPQPSAPGRYRPGGYYVVMEVLVRADQ